MTRRSSRRTHYREPSAGITFEVLNATALALSRSVGHHQHGDEKSLFWMSSAKLLLASEK